MPGLLRGVARTAVVAGTATAVSNRVSRRQINRWSNDDQSSYPQDYAVPPQQYAPQPQYAAPAPQYAPPPPAPAAPAALTDEMLDQLRQLGELKEQGILTDAEFAEQKARVLAG
jgi:hypothetical protein